MIYCPQCGTPNADTASACGNCQTALPRSGEALAAGASPQPAGVPPAARPTINNYLIPAIVVTICCCLPGGIVSIVYAAQVNTKLQAGDIAGAQAASNNAKLWCMISAGGGVLVALCYLAYFGLAFMGAMSQN